MRSKLRSRIRRVRDEVEAIEHALEQEKGRSDLLQLIASARVALNGLMFEILNDYIRTQIVDPAKEPDRERASATEDLIDIIRSYLK